MAKATVLVVDDSAVVRQFVCEVLGRERTLRVIGAVADPIFAMQRMELAWPDVVVLDLQMPRMDGLTFLRRIMATRPTPVVVCSSFTTAGAKATLEALAAGAVSVVAKPRAGIRGLLQDASEDLAEAVKAAAQANRRNLLPEAVPPAPMASTSRGSGRPGEPRGVVVVGASTGGTQALEQVLAALPTSVPGIVVVQHMPPAFTGPFADRLDGLARIAVREARDGDRVLPGHALIAPGGRQTSLQRTDDGYRVQVKDAPPVNRHRPSVDVLFRSAARAAGRDALAILMTGMGADGARGLAELRAAGAATLAQDEASCVVYGMPGEAVKLGAVQRSLPLPAIAAEIAALASAA